MPRVSIPVAAAWTTTFGMACAGTAIAQEAADTLYFGGPILTINDAMPQVEAVAVRDGQIMAAGLLTDMLSLQSEQTRTVDLDGRTMLPGFVDSHGHVVLGGLQALSANLLAPPDGEVTDIASLQAELTRWIADNRAALDEVNLVVGFGYDPAQLAEGRHPTRDDLDAVTTDWPVYIVHQSGHIGVANTRALEAISYDAETENPPGGVIQRHPDSNAPNGVLEGNAHFPAIAGLLSDLGAEGFMAFGRAGSELWARYGFTTAQEGRATPDTVEILRALSDAGDLKQDVAIYPDITADRDFILQNTTSDYQGRVRVAGAKLTIDGSPQGFTALRDRPYFDPLGNFPPGYTGLAYQTVEEINEFVDWSFENGIQLITHANGERASDHLIEAIDLATRKHGPGDRRPVLIHGQFLREDQVDSYARLDVFPSLFPMHTFYWGDWHRDRTVGPERADNISPTGWLKTRGMRFGTHHDAPVAFPDSMRVLDATVTRRTRSGDILGPAQRVDVMTALKAMTLWPAYQHFEDDQKGSIEVGKHADFVVLSEDPTAIDPEKLDTIQVLMTIKDDQVIFEAQNDVSDGLLAPGGSAPHRTGISIHAGHHILDMAYRAMRDLN